ncbi:hypothetical protein O181_037514 [Austropuccinia psidii MF-1]|uniref:Integrase catalytic domain-containing protein n=1 Tax=Austropuccinia psidii MF-1 TaxID=1389203 RepID=A0A9Q3HCN5_9BASI|nr:hypothetical protein [Austropuccinia psidii MF-1]
MNDLCRNHTERPTNPVIFRAMDQTLLNGFQASTECFALPSTPNYWSKIAPLCWKIDLLKRTGQSCTSAMPQSCPITPSALESSQNVQQLRSSFMLSRRGAALKLGVEADELEGLLAQSGCHAPPNLGQVAFDQLVTAEILARGNKKPFSAFPTSPDLLRQQMMYAAALNILSINLGGHAFTAAIQDTGKPTAHTPKGSQTQGLRYLLTIQDHVLTYSIVYPIKSCLEAPEAILDAIKQLQVRLGATPKALQTDNAWEFTSTTFTSALIKLEVAFCPSLPYLPQENGEAERPNRTLGDMARAMMVQRGMPECVNSLPHQELFGTALSITTLYPFGVDAIVHVPADNQPHKLASRGIECNLLKPLIFGGWLLWEPSTNKMVQLASVVFPQFQPLTVSSGPVVKGSLSHVVNTMSLGEVPTEGLFDAENQAIDSLILVKDVNIPEHLGETLSVPHRKQWRQACIAELDQMAARDVLEVVERSSHMKTISHQWVFDLKQKIDGSVERFKARLVAHRDRQQPGVDCMEMYAPTAALMSLHLVLETAFLKNWWVASFNVSGAYWYSCKVWI